MEHVTGHIKALQGHIFRTLSEQKYFSVLAPHGHEILLSFMLFTVLSWITYYWIAPCMPPSKKKDSVASDYARAKWGHMVVSFVHAIISCVWCLWLWHDASMAGTLEQRALGYSPRFGQLFAVSEGYFIWDVLCCLWYVKQYGLGFLMHAILGCGAILACYGPFMMYPTSRFLLFEVSTIFVDMHWFLEKLGYGKSFVILLNDALGLLAYLGIRLIFGSYLTYIFMVDLIALWNRVPLVYSILAILANCTTHLLNFYWFYKLVLSIFKRSKTPSSIDAKKRH